MLPKYLLPIRNKRSSRVLNLKFHQMGSWSIVSSKSTSYLHMSANLVNQRLLTILGGRKTSEHFVIDSHRSAARKASLSCQVKKKRTTTLNLLCHHRPPKIKKKILQILRWTRTMPTRALIHGVGCTPAPSKSLSSRSRRETAFDRKTSLNSPLSLSRILPTCNHQALCCAISQFLYHPLPLQNIKIPSAPISLMKKSIRFSPNRRKV